MSRITFFAVLSVVAFGAAPAPAQNKLLAWPGFRGPEGKGILLEGSLPLKWSEKENLLWKKTLPGRGTSSPIVVGKHIFVTYYAGADPSKPGSLEGLERHLLCMAHDGETVRDTVVPSVLPELVQRRDPHGYASATPVSDGERIYAFFGRSGVFGFSMEGKQLWQTSVGTGLEDWGNAASPILYKDLVIVNASVESKSMVALEKDSGKERWRAPKIDQAWNTPILVQTAGGKTELVVAVFGKVLGFDPDTGVQLWSCATDIPWYMVPSMVADDGIVYCIGGRNPGGALAIRAGGKGDVTRTHRLWSIKKGSNVASPIHHKGHVYFANDNLGIFYCVKADSGATVYEERAQRPDQIYSSPVLVGDKIYYTSRSGITVVVLAAPAFKVLALNDLRDRSVFNSSPAVFENRILIRSDRNLYCVGAK